jgi:hypothetical protein
MKRHKENVEESLRRRLALFKSPPQREMDLAEARIQQRLHSAPAYKDGELPVESSSTERSRKFKGLALVVAAAAAAAAVILAVVLYHPAIQTFIRGIDANTVLESEDGQLFQISGGSHQAVHRGERLETGDVLRTGEDARFAY